MLQDILVRILLEQAIFGNKIQDSDDIQVKGSFVLDAIEKNPNVEGTIAEKVQTAINRLNKLGGTMDTIIKLPAGSSVASDAEIAAAKVGPKGETYETLQSAITDQILRYRGVVASNNQPSVSSDYVMWINTKENSMDSAIIPEVKDDVVSLEDTWSSKKIQDKMDSLSKKVNDINQGNIIISDELITNRVNNWLYEHPEATTTLRDGAVSMIKLAPDVTDRFSGIDKEIRKIKLDITNIPSSEENVKTFWGTEHSGKFLIINSEGYVEAKSLPKWEAGSY